MVIWGVKATLYDRWDLMDFKVEMYRDEIGFRDIIRIGLMTDQGPIYVTQIVTEAPWVDDEERLKSYRLSDETIATIMLLLG